jgi:hypothetical protein
MMKNLYKMHIPRDCVAAAKEVIYTTIGRNMIDLNKILGSPAFSSLPVTVIVMPTEINDTTSGTKKRKLGPDIPINRQLVAVSGTFGLACYALFHTRLHNERSMQDGGSVYIVVRKYSKILHF